MYAPSGYGQQMAELLPLIRDEGYPLAICNFFGLQGGKVMIDGIVQYPIINHTYGSDAMVLHAQDFGADVVFSLQDIWVLHPDDLSKVNRWIPITPIDHWPAPKPILEKLRFAYRVVSYSQFGRDQLRENGFSSTYIPHTVNTDIFKPTGSKAERKIAGNQDPNTFIWGMVAANKDNPPRKSFQEVMDAFKLFLNDVPNSKLYIHTNPDFPGGFPIKQYAMQLGIFDKVIYPDTYQLNFNTPKETMNLIYNTFDAYVGPSVNEGFNVPLIEAQACGLPVITNDWTAQKELIIPGKTGFLTEIAAKKWSPLQGYYAIPKVESIYEQMIKVYKADREKMGRDARQHILTNYDTKRVYFEKWKPFLERLEKEIYPDLANAPK